MEPAQNPPKACYNCVKRRIVCDRTGTRCRKCAKKGLRCPGYGIRYRFAHEFRDQKLPPAPRGTGPAVDYSGPLTWVKAGIGRGGSAPGVGASAGLEMSEEDGNAGTPSSEATSEGEQREEVTTEDELQVEPVFERPRTIQPIDANSRWMFQYCMPSNPPFSKSKICCFFRPRD
ncbi:hypothetical protein AK830_g9453 [Neonectria ditissima]|uniref:Zn(2)-C6 fungal-type domain-containing protein n=1 Tax=Neonectria ditissima TaxID=78410 RepID=A0A0P7AUS7_9HYPO|nr:hypothetical protein AK830_g9453 [Neonectria ditissima]